MKKKLALLLAATIALLGMMQGCSGNPSNTSAGEVNVYNWGEYIDESILADFEAETGIKVNYRTFETNEQLYGVLRQGGASYDVIIPSDYMISRMITEDMLEKLNFDNIPNFSNIVDDFRSPEYDPSGEYSVPYAWGTVGLIYNAAVIGDEIDSWSALFDEAYAGQILMFDNSRDAMGIALKYLGYSLNSTDSAELDEAFELLCAQKPLLQAYVMDQIFDKLESGEAAIGPYYAGDYLTMLENNPDLLFVLPKEGSNHFVDAMCIPKGAANKENAEAFINFMCTQEISARNMEFVGYASPITGVRDMLGYDEDELEIIYPNAETLSRCEVFINLPQATLDMYDDYWVRLKSLPK